MTLKIDGDQHQNRFEELDIPGGLEVNEFTNYLFYLFLSN